jgi:hypothetical protein
MLSVSILKDSRYISTWLEDSGYTWMMLPVSSL